MQFIPFSEQENKYTYPIYKIPPREYAQSHIYQF